MVRASGWRFEGRRFKPRLVLLPFSLRAHTHRWHNSVKGTNTGTSGGAGKMAIKADESGGGTLQVRDGQFQMMCSLTWCRFFDAVRK